MSPKNFLESRQGLLLIRQSQSLRQFVWMLKGIEPRSKNAMPNVDKAAIQESLAKQLLAFHRRAYHGPIALDLWFGTTERNPAHIQTITKNLLDLFATPRYIKSNRKALLYWDDRQITGLSVHCDHGCTEPFIYLRAVPFGSIMHDLEVIARNSTFEDQVPERQTLDHHGTIESLEELESERDQYGPELYRTLKDRYTKEALVNWLSGARISLRDLYMWYPLKSWSTMPWKDAMQQILESHPNIYHLHPGRILLGELPHSRGQSSEYQRHIREVLEDHKRRFERRLNTISVPLGIEVIIKPPSQNSQSDVHDLDNVCRDYLVPGIVEAFSPPLLEGHLGNSPGLGVTHYEVWRLPRTEADKAPGFVSVALAPSVGHDSLVRTIERAIEQVLDRID